MKKAVLYARVSSALQEKEKTIDSQIAELKRQITGNGDVLIKEYIDNGYSGAQLDRPAMNALRQDIKTDLFDTIYFLNTDRIAREVTYQTIIISEILKYKKQIIINGKDYVHNPENKFALTVLGAVSELERAKIIERSVRGKMHRLKQGYILNSGCNNLLGYNYVKRYKDRPAQMVINGPEAKIIRYIYEQYAKGVSWHKLIVALEDKGIKTKNGCKLWDTQKLRLILTNSTYYGIKYFNKTAYEKKSNDPLRKIKYGKRVLKDKSEWIAIQVPAIVSKSLFDKVQTRLKENKEMFRKKHEIQLLSNLLYCGNCGHHFSPYQRYYRYKLVDGSYKVTHKIAYLCILRAKNRMHSKKVSLQICKSPEVSTRVLDQRVFEIIENTMLDPDKLLAHSDYIKQKSDLGSTLENDINKIENSITKLKQEKKELLNQYATGKMSRTQYSTKCKKYEEKIENLNNSKNELIKKVPIIQKKDIVVESVKRFCENASDRFEQIHNFDTKRQFLLDHIEKIIYLNKKVTLCGSISIDEVNKIEFSIENKV
jgi:site-specific DNA recombinase